VRPEPYSALTHLECPSCGARYDPGQLQSLCECGSPLLARYDLECVGARLDRADIAARPPDLWRYHELLPVADPARVVTFGEGMTPLFPLPRFGRGVGVPGLLLKDESPLPTGTFKARGAAVGVSRAAELGAVGAAMPTNGNAGAAWAVYAARAGLGALIAMPSAAPVITRTECATAGADLRIVDGLIGDAAALVAGLLAGLPGYIDAGTLREPYRLEGKKTIGLELAEQLGWRLPDVLVCPVGGGVAIIGIYKALRELRQLGWVDPAAPLPRLVAVQASGCAPIVAAFAAGADRCEPWPEPSTVAFGLTVPRPLGDVLVLDAIRATGGTAVAVDDAKLLTDRRVLAATEGCLICPEGAAAIAAVRQLRESGWLTGPERVVALNTGTGLKYP
jgi:threonine synthase